MDVYCIGEQIVAAEDAKISVNDLVVLRGYGAFDFLRTYNGHPFHLKAHINRLERSAQLIGLSLPMAKEKIAELVVQAIAQSDHREKKIRIVVTGGLSPDGITPATREQLLIMVTGVTPLPKEWQSKGAKLITSHFQRFMPGAKSINYIPAIISLKEAESRGAIEAIFVDQNGYLQEGTTSSIFFVADGTLCTPPCDRILPGITRETVLSLYGSDHQIIERPIHQDELALMDEVFITSSVREIVPVRALDSYYFTEGAGPVTAEIIRRFGEYTGAYRGE